jgi:hypothetical protein
MLFLLGRTACLIGVINHDWQSQMHVYFFACEERSDPISFRRIYEGMLINLLDIVRLSEWIYKIKTTCFFDILLVYIKL